MRVIFADSAFYIALINHRDSLHARAVALFESLYAQPGVVFVTTEAVLVEVLTRLARTGPRTRAATADFVARLSSDPRVTVVPFTTDLFEAGLELYRRRPDKAYSMTDCMSMALCRQQRITEILTSDHDFEQERFRILLGRP